MDLRAIPPIVQRYYRRWSGLPVRQTGYLSGVNDIGQILVILYLTADSRLTSISQLYFTEYYPFVQGRSAAFHPIQTHNCRMFYAYSLI